MEHLIYVSYVSYVWKFMYIISMSHIHEQAIPTNCGTAVYSWSRTIFFMAIVTITDIQQQYIYTDTACVGEKMVLQVKI